MLPSCLILFKQHNNFLLNAFKCTMEEYAGPTLYVPEEKEVFNINF